MHAGQYFDEIEVGTEKLTPRVTVTEAHVLAYAGVAGDFSPVHMDETYAKTTLFGGRVAHGLMGLSLADGLKVQSGFFRDGASLGWTWDFKRPIRIGDTLQVRFRVTDKRVPKSKPGMGILTIAFDLLNQDGEVVQTGEHRLMIPRDPALVATEIAA